MQLQVVAPLAVPCVLCDAAISVSSSAARELSAGSAQILRCLPRVLAETWALLSGVWGPLGFAFALSAAAVCAWVLLSSLARPQAPA